MSQYLKNPILLALDMDDREEALSITRSVADVVGGIKLGPRLVLRYGEHFVKEVADQCPVFIDMKFLDIPSTMEASVRTAFALGATFVTVHTWAGKEALSRLAKLEKELSATRPFKILGVSILTSFSPETLPPTMIQQGIQNHVGDLANLAVSSGLTGLVCSPQEVSSLREKYPDLYLVTPGVRIEKVAEDDQKRVMTPREAIQQGASALVIGRPIYQAPNVAEKAAEYVNTVEGL